MYNYKRQERLEIARVVILVSLCESISTHESQELARMHKPRLDPTFQNVRHILREMIYKMLDDDETLRWSESVLAGGEVSLSHHRFSDGSFSLTLN